MRRETLRPTLVLAAMSLLLVAACATWAAEKPLNQPPEGFVALFNGKDLTGWKGLLKGPYDNPDKRAALAPEKLAKLQQEADEDMRAHWKVVDGVLVFDGKGRSLCTAKDYGDFEMLVDWKIEKGGDSGIYLRGSPQVQIWDTGQSHGRRRGRLRRPLQQPEEPEQADEGRGQARRRVEHVPHQHDRRTVTVILNDELVSTTSSWRTTGTRDQADLPHRPDRAAESRQLPLLPQHLHPRDPA